MSQTTLYLYEPEPLTVLFLYDDNLEISFFLLSPTVRGMLLLSPRPACAMREFREPRCYNGRRICWICSHVNIDFCFQKKILVATVNPDRQRDLQTEQEGVQDHKPN